MAASTVVESLSLTSLHVNGIDIALYGVGFIGYNDYRPVLGVESTKVLYHEIASGQLSNLSRTYIIYIKVVVSVFLTLHDKLLIVPWQEYNRMHGFHIFVACLAIELLLFVVCCGIITHELAVVLQSVEFKHINRLTVRTPCYVGEIAVGRVAGVEILHPAGCAVVDTHSHLMACHSEHRVFVGFVCSHSLEGVHLGIIRHHGLVHTIECKPISVGSPEDTLFNTEFIAVNRLSIHNLSCTVGGELLTLSLSIRYPQLVVLYVGRYA